MLAPHLAYLHVIADCCPHALATYLLCHQLADDNNALTLNDASLEANYTTRTVTLNALRKLAHAGLLEYNTRGERINITLASSPAAILDEAG